MAKGRMIDRKIRSSESFAKLTYRQRDLWQGLIEVADDQGRLPGHPAKIRSMVWGYDDITISEVEADLGVLEKAGNILRYSKNGSDYIQLINWHIYQEGAAWLGPSDYPAPDGWQDRCRYHGKNNDIITLNWNTLPSNLPSALPSRDVKGDVNDDIKGEVEEAAPSAKTFITIPAINQNGNYAVAERIYRGITGHMTLPSNKRDDAVTVILRYYQREGGEEKAIIALKPYCRAWLDRKYRPDNMGWLVDWAAAESIPPPKIEKKELTREERELKVIEAMAKRNQ